MFEIETLTKAKLSSVNPRVPEPIMGKLTTLVQHDLQITLEGPDTGDIGIE